MEYNYSVTMFAHNEQEQIKSAVESVISNSDSSLTSLIVIANGCTDNTDQILKELSSQKEFEKLSVVELELGDKCNAWNHYVHDLAGDNDVHFFVDSDVRFTKSAFPRMAESLVSDTRANAIAGLPFSGRNQSQYEGLVVNGWCLFGGCYGVKKRYIELLRERAFRLPIGLGWIDSEITKAIHSDVGLIKSPEKGRIICNPKCGYEFDSLSIFKKSDWSLYKNRIARYRLGQLQEQYLDKLDYKDWPENLLDINKAILKDIECSAVFFDFKNKYLVKKRVEKFIKKFS